MPWHQEGEPCPGGIKRGITSQAGQGIVLLDPALVQPPITCCEQCGVPQFEQDVKVSKRRSPKLVKGLEGMSCKQ